ncbi:hypothetical protein C2S52_003892 [Perilla frutescens var. hirtella]|uniref:GH10 domain-containing protein n=1 Tax=Perilla frutescens var. hirtella TaxID=608512 RepID=A0AAD4JHK2_PERFH|nr:hypothetical protein C2S52_003892 [Perilla frutescens var. hirtella]KAH6833268.1 hypothetical protein C2S53_018102 [Perilla frutescens var. hirtella]
MKCFLGWIFVIFCALLLSGCALADSDSDSSSYDYSASIHCRSEPSDPQYGGGLVKNSKFNSGLDDWKVFGNATWFQVSEGDETLVAYMQTSSGEFILVGSVIAKFGCWSMLKGGFTADDDMKVDLFIRCPATKIEVWIDNVSLKQFTKVEWRHHQQKSIDKIRKRNVRIHVKNEQGEAIKGANITLTQTRPLFTIGSGSPASILEYKGYQDYFTARFTAATPHNEMKWYFTEDKQGQENYTVADAMVSFFTSNGISVRGHNILWDSQNATPHWVPMLPRREIVHATVRRTASVVSRYSGNLIGWDVMNENLHNLYFESVLGANASAMYYQIVRALDPHTPLFLNEFNTLEYPRDLKVIPSRYIHRIREIKSFPGNEDLMLRIGLESHFTLRPNVSYIRAAFDVLGATGIPIWLTELDTQKGPAQVEQLEDVMREAFSHPAMEGMIVWGGWKPTACSDACLNVENYDKLPNGCSQLCLIDNNFKNLEAGDLVDKLIDEWRSRVKGVTNNEGDFHEKVFHGAYNITCSHPLMPNSLHTTFNVTKEEGTLDLSITLK